MNIEELIKNFTEASVSGASKTQVERKFKETYKTNKNKL